jgi:hypothetical protein
MKYLTHVLIVFSLLGSGYMQAQSTVPVTGGNAAGTGGTADYTVGQAVYTTNSGLSGTVAQGVQQPYEIIVVTGLEEAVGINVEFEVYPNPSSDYVKLAVKNCELQNICFQLYNINGSLIQNKNIIDKETVIDMGKLPPGAYYLHINDNQRDVKTFKIIKNQ